MNRLVFAVPLVLTLAACADQDEAANPAGTQVAIAPEARTGVPMAPAPSSGGVPMVPSTAAPAYDYASPPAVPGYGAPAGGATAAPMPSQAGVPGLATSPETREDLDADALDTRGSAEGAAATGAAGGAGVPAQ
jgi:hypothetical protein